VENRARGNCGKLVAALDFCDTGGDRVESTLSFFLDESNVFNSLIDFEDFFDGIIVEPGSR
jgi:hypothetical protein